MGNRTRPGPAGFNHSISIQDGTSATAASPTPSPTGGPEDVSIEIGACFIPVPTRLHGLTPAEMQVLAWLRANRPEIVKAEQTFRVDRRAIAGAIAWEMLKNVKTQRALWVGPGKVHIWDYDKHNWAASLATLAYNSWILGDPGKGTLAEEVEERGYLPKRTYGARFRILGTSQGAITYIAAAMAAFADIAAARTSQDLRSNPEILTNAYQSKTLTTWDAAVAKKPPGSSFTGGNPMDIWVHSHKAFLEDGVGKPDLPESAP
jgi:hypothetical protein